jgi:primosomal protein N' (replication factor Y)
VRRPEIVSVVVATPVAGCFDYIVAEHLSVVAGSVVMVPFGNRRLPGIVLGPGSGDVAVEKLRCLEDVSDVPALPAALIPFMQRFADWTLSPLGAVAKMILSQPAALAPAALQKRFFRPESLPAKQRMTPARQRVLGALADGAHLTAKDLSVAADASPAVIAAMAAQGLLGSRSRGARSAASRATM